jgi:hypothetical protein
MAEHAALMRPIGGGDRQVREALPAQDAPQALYIPSRPRARGSRGLESPVAGFGMSPKTLFSNPPQKDPWVGKPRPRLPHRRTLRSAYRVLGMTVVGTNVPAAIRASCALTCATMFAGTILPIVP